MKSSAERPKKQVVELSKHPVQALNELRPGLIKFEMKGETGDSHNKMFTCEVIMIFYFE